jgi:di/tricarboxylate transporter
MAEFVYLGVVLAAAVWLFWTQRLRTDFTALLVMLAMVLPWPHPGMGWSAVLDPEEGFAGFGSGAVIMIAGMFVLAGAIEKTGAAEALGLRLLRHVASNERLMQFTVLCLATIGSTLINDTTVVLIMLPLIVTICKERRLSPSRYLMFAAYGSLLGGQWTLIGTRSNIILSDFLRQRTGSGIGFFDFAPLGLAVFAAAAVFLMVIGRRMLPAGESGIFSDPVKKFLTELIVADDSAVAGSRLDELEVFSTDTLKGVILMRDGRRISRLAPLKDRDVIMVRGTVDRIGELIKSAEFLVREESNLDDAALESVDLVTVEAVLPGNSRYAGSTLDQVSLGDEYGITVLGVARHGRSIAERVMHTRLERGDSVLLLGSAGDVEHLRGNSDLLLLREETFAAIGKRKAWMVSLLLASVIGLAISGLLSPTISIPAAAVLAVLLNCVSWRSVYDTVDWPVLITLGSMISFGLALEKTGAAEGIALLLVDALRGLSPEVLLAALLLVAILLTQVIENAAVAIIVAPIAFHTAQATGMSATPIMIALAVCISAGFSTPVAHESTILVMGPGRYEFRHYLAIGGILALLTWMVAALLTPIIWNGR